MARAGIKAGRGKRPGNTAIWTGCPGYFKDPDGHLREVAHNPYIPLDADGRLVLPAPET